MSATARAPLLLLLAAALSLLLLATDESHAAVVSRRGRGSCPRLPPVSQRVCGQEGCSDDNGCPNGLICCSNGCVHVCRNPVY